MTEKRAERLARAKKRAAPPKKAGPKSKKGPLIAGLFHFWQNP